MSWLFSRALVEAYSEDTSLAGEPSALLNVMPTQRQFWRNDKMMDVLSRSPFGLMWKPLTDDRGKELLTLFRAAFPVKTSQPPARAQGSPEHDLGYGERWQELSAKYDLDSRSWKTHLCLWVEDLPWSSVILPRWGMMRDGVCWEDITQGGVRTVKDAGFMLLRPTASTIPHTMGMKSLIRKNHGDGNLHEQLARVHQKVNTPRCSEILMRWPENWTDLKPLGMDRFQQWQDSHGRY